jgi:hypothetical protein
MGHLMGRGCFLLLWVGLGVVEAQFVEVGGRVVVDAQCASLVSTQFVEAQYALPVSAQFTSL